LRALPDRPRFIFCSSNLTTGSLFRFSKRYIADYRSVSISIRIST
jgi:NTE family protein